MSPAPVIIAIDGRSGAGKTTLAIELAAQLRGHHRVSLFHLEDVYPGWNGLTAGIERYVTTVLTPLRRGESATWISWDWERHYDGPVRVTSSAEIIIVEGVGAAAAAARPFLDAVIWADAPEEERRARALRRDGGSYEPFWDQWASQETEWLAGDNPLDHADVRVLNDADGQAPADVLQTLRYLPALTSVLAPELSARRGLTICTERIEATPDAAGLFAALYASSPNAVWLDSSNSQIALATERSRFSIMADDGGSFGQVLQHRSGINTVTAGCAVVETQGPFFRWLDTVWGRKAVRAPEGYPGDFTLGWLGYLGYELKRETGGSDVMTDTPDAALIFAGRAVVMDHSEGTVWLLALDAPEAASWLKLARSAVTLAQSAEASQAARAGGSNAVERSLDLNFLSRDSELDYKRKIAAAQHEIADGNSYEVCLTTALSTKVKAGNLDQWETYLALRRNNPAPFASYLRLGDLTISSTSPERFLRMASDGGMRAEPIKGTRRRAADPAADEILRHELASSLKDRAENIMIVDLLRNDLSHFAEPGSVTVSRLCEIESYATVHQLVSTIDAKLRPGSSRAEAVAACFPAGSMTGAPKISTMAILDLLEEAPRGVYSGAIGYFSLNGATDLAVAIRTLVMQGESTGADGAGTLKLSLGVGGAITADSAPQEEYEEIRVKAFGVLSALGAEFPTGHLTAG